MYKYNRIFLSESKVLIEIWISLVNLVICLVFHRMFMASPGLRTTID